MTELLQSETLVPGDRWFALYTKPHKEYVVRDRLRSQGVDTYLPEISVAARRRDRRATKPFFPHYLFAHFDPSGGTIARLRWTPGLRRVVSAGGQPVAIPGEVVAHIRRRLADLVEVESACPFQHGEVVRVLHGPFEGLGAVFDRSLSPEGRARVFLQMMDRLVAADLDVCDLLPPR